MGKDDIAAEQKPKNVRYRVGHNSSRKHCDVFWFMLNSHKWVLRGGLYTELIKLR